MGTTDPKSGISRKRFPVRYDGLDRINSLQHRWTLRPPHRGLLNIILLLPHSRYRNTSFQGGGYAAIEKCEQGHTVLADRHQYAGQFRAVDCRYLNRPAFSRRPRLWFCAAVRTRWATASHSVRACGWGCRTSRCNRTRPRVPRRACGRPCGGYARA